MSVNFYSSQILQEVWSCIEAVCLKFPLLLAFACVHGHEITSGSAGLALYNLMIQLFLISGWISATGKDKSVLPALARPGITTTVHQDIASVVCIKNLESEMCQGNCSIKYVHVVQTKLDKTGY